MNLLLIPVGLLYLLISATLFIFGANFIYLSVRAMRDGQSRSQPPEMSEWPYVTVQLPIYNEMYVAERVIQAAAKLDYPAELLQIQVLDDSTDETKNLVQRTVTSLQAQGVKIVRASH